jgi:antitoxin component YwqK of YwqJK toxin-antitoxin module
MIEAYYHNDKLSGNYIHYYQNGIVKEEGLFKDGAKVGEWKYYDISGNLISTDNYMESPIDGYMEIIEDE